jgi:predicted HD phosphohydrolase
MADIEKNVNEVFELYHKFGDHEYLGEKLTQTQHMIQCAMNAESDHQPPEVVLGALLHDIGNLVGHDRTDVEKVIVNDVNIGPKDHDALGEAYLKQHGFPLDVYSFARGHVNAIRYMAFKDPKYKESLSWTSQKTLERRGGPLTAAEAKEFEKLPHYDAIVKCRSWDENAKDPKRKTEPLEKYKKMAIDFLKSKTK